MGNALASKQDTLDSARCLCVQETEDDRLVQEAQLAEMRDDIPEPGEIVQCVVQFTCALYFCDGGESLMTVDVVRFGDCSRPVSCLYMTEDASAKAGENYTQTSGALIFEAEETLKSIDIPILHDEAWNATLEFRVILSDVRGGDLGKYLFQSRVKIIDNDYWPSNKFEKEITRGAIPDIDGGSLTLEYIKLLLRDTRVRADTLKLLASDQIRNLYFFLTLYLQLYMVDVVLATDTGETGLSSSLVPDVLIIPSSRQQTALVVAVMYFLPFLLTAAIDEYKCHLSIPGTARKSVQTNLMTKFMNCKEEVRANILPSRLTMAYARDIFHAVDEGFMNILQVVRIVGKMSLALFFILAENRIATVPLVVYPLVLGTWFFSREKTTAHAISEQAKRQDFMAAKVDEIVLNIRLISDFFLRERAGEGLAEAIDKFHAAEREARSVACTNAVVAPLLTAILVSTFMALGATCVEGVGDGSVMGHKISTMSLGTFLATINIFKEVGSELEGVFQLVLAIQRSFAPLRSITRLMNMESDMSERKAVNRRRRYQGREQREAARMRREWSPRPSMSGPMTSVSFPVDSVEISISNLSYNYTGSASSSVPCGPAIRGISATFAQGKLYALVGPPRQGKATLLRLIGQVILPSEGQGQIFVPPHLRILHVARDTTVLRASFLQNVLLSNMSVEVAGGIDRIKRICKRVGFHSDTIESLFKERQLDDEAVLDWTSKFSATDFSRLNLVRVFVMNPEVLVIHHPALFFADSERPQVIRLLKEHVDQKGLEMPLGSSAGFRRPRTVFFSASFFGALNLADQVYEISAAEGLRDIPFGDFREIDQELLK